MTRHHGGRDEYTVREGLGGGRVPLDSRLPCIQKIGRGSKRGLGEKDRAADTDIVAHCRKGRSYAREKSECVAGQIRPKQNNGKRAREYRNQ